MERAYLSSKLTKAIMSNLLNVPSPYQLRAELETAIINDLLGPVVGENEDMDYQLHYTFYPLLDQSN